MNEQLLQLLESGLSVQECCAKIGVTRKQFYDLMREDREFAERIMHSGQADMLVLMDSMYVNGLKGNVQAAKQFLQMRDAWENPKESYVDQQLRMLRNLKT